MSDEEKRYRVGYGKPPEATRWKPGCASPNPDGRRKRSARAALQADIAEVLATPITGTSGGRTERLTLAKASFRKLVQRAIKGDNAATAYVLTSMRALSALADREEVQQSRYADSVRKFIALIIDDPEEQQRVFDEYYANKKKGRRRR